MSKVKKYYTSSAGGGKRSPGLIKAMKTLRKAASKTFFEGRAKAEGKRNTPRKRKAKLL